MRPFVFDYISLFRRRGLRSTLYFDRPRYQMYEDMFGHPRSDEWRATVALADCDSIYLGDISDPDMRCPRCGGFAFPEGDG